ncbi:MAG: MFS transporter [Candidatus Hodarchaeales archaeon]|jgi:MFS family permease
MGINNYLGIEKLPDNAQYYFRTYVVFQVFRNFFFLLSNTFFLLFLVDQVGFAQASLVLSVMFLVQLLSDYPSGSLGDWIGQRWILTIAYLSYFVAFFLLSTANSFVLLAIAAAFNGFGNAQHSGAIDTWLDNNYQQTIGDSDPDRKIYGFCQSRAITIIRFVSAFAILVGGSLATALSRQFVFFVQALMTIFMIIFAFSFISKTVIEKEKDGVSNRLLGGLKFVFSSKTAFFFIFGTAIFFSAFTIWGNLILLPIYFGYTGSDGLASLLRTIVFIVGLPVSWKLAKFSQRFEKIKNPHVTSLFVVLYFPGFILVTSIIPMTDQLNLIGSILIIILLTAVIPIFDLSNILRQRFFIDLVPKANRNAVYSLIPTIIAIFGIFLLPFGGMIIETSGLIAGMVVSFILSVLASIMIFIGVYFYQKDLTLESSRLSVSQPSTKTVVSQ